MPTLLVIDDETNVLYSLERSLTADSLRVITAPCARHGLEMVRQRKPDAVLLDVRLPDMPGLEAFEEIRRIDPRLPVIMMTAFATTDTAIDAMKRGAFEYLLKPVDLVQLRSVVARALELSRLVRVPAVIADDRPAETGTDRIVGRTPAMQEVYKSIGRVAGLDVNVLILGESGTGKELVARAIYQHSARANKPFLAINCAAIPETLLESELFGHERGAFTGADQRRIGKFEQADGGTILLDEIGDMTPATQSKVLRVLQDLRLERLGGSETIQTDVRVIAATNQNLAELVAGGRFRSDLYYRLKVYTIELPPLRERLDDLPLLVDHFIGLFNHELGRNVFSVLSETIQRMAGYSWPGNVRELQSAIQFAMVNARGDVLTADCLPDACRPGGLAAGGSGAAEARGELAEVVGDLLRSGATDIYERVGQVVDRLVLEEVLRHVQGNQVEASQRLGISRTTLRAKLRLLGLSVEKQVQSESGHADQSLNSD